MAKKDSAALFHVTAVKIRSRYDNFEACWAKHAPSYEGVGTKGKQVTKFLYTKSMNVKKKLKQIKACWSLETRELAFYNSNVK